MFYTGGLLSYYFICFVFLLLSYLKVCRSEQLDAKSFGLVASGANVTRTYSPLTLNQDWPAVTRLVTMTTCSCLGTIINGFYVAGFFIENSPKRVGNVYLACIGMTDVMITGIVMPVSAVLLLSGQGDTVVVCRTVQFIVQTSVQCYSFFFTLVALEAYLRLCRSSAEYRQFISVRMDVVVATVFGVSVFISSVGVFQKLDFDYCERLHYGNYEYRITSFLIFFGIPFLIIAVCTISSLIVIRRRARLVARYRRSHQYDTDCSITTLNITAYCLYVMCWIPYVIVIYEFPDTPDRHFYNCAWLGVGRSMITSIIYSAFNQDFRQAFEYIFYYVCCKTTLPRPHHARFTRGDIRLTRSNIRVHVMHQGVNYAIPHRAVVSCRETQSL